MKPLKSFIKESLDIDNIFWKLSLWFRNHDDEKSSFNELLDLYKSKKLTSEELNEYIIKNNNKLKVSKLVDFLDDSPLPQENRDYLYIMGKILDTLASNKTETF